MRSFLLLFAFAVFPMVTVAAQPQATFRPASLPGGGEAHFMGTTWTYEASTASKMNRFDALRTEQIRAKGVVGDYVALRRPVLPGALPASVRSASHLVFEAEGEGTVFVALEVSDRAEPFVYPVQLHPGIEAFRIPLERFRHRATRAPFRSTTVTHVAFYVVPPASATAPAPFDLTIGDVAFEHKRPLSARY